MKTFSIRKKCIFPRLFAALLIISVLLSAFPSAALAVEGDDGSLFYAQAETAETPDDDGVFSVFEVNAEQQDEPPENGDTLFVEGHGDGLSAETAWRISTAADLQLLATNVNSGTTYQDKYFKLMNDIDLSSVCGATAGPGGTPLNWIPIGYNITLPNNGGLPFEGTFDGDEFIICNLYFALSAGSPSQAALFGEISNAEINNLTVSGSINITNRNGNCSAGLVGLAKDSIIANCVNHVDMSNTNTNANTYGGIVGRGDNVTITGCINYGDISVAKTAGGIVGSIPANTSATNTITNCKNYGAISVSGASVGGIVGNLTSTKLTIANCENSGNIRGSNAGGIAGNVSVAQYEVVIKDCTNTADIIGGSERVGGIVGIGFVGMVIENCANTGDVSSSGAGGTENAVGGIIGYLSSGSTPFPGSTIVNCVNSGSISGAAAIGGLIGRIGFQIPTEYNFVISGCYNTESVTGQVHSGTASDSRVGGLVGSVYSHEASLANFQLSSCWNSGDVTAPGSVSVGGLFGEIQSGGGVFKFSNLYTSGEVSGYDAVGGTAGNVDILTHPEVPSGNLFISNVYSVAPSVTASAAENAIAGVGIGKISSRTDYGKNRINISNVFAREYGNLPGIGEWTDGTSVDPNDIVLLNDNQMTDGGFAVLLGGAFAKFGESLFSEIKLDDEAYAKYYPVYGDFDYPVLLPLLGLESASTYNVKFSGAKYADVTVNGAETYATAVAPGGGVSFTVEPAQDVTIASVTVGGDPLTAAGGTYTLAGIQADTVVTITTEGTPPGEGGGEPGDYNVTFDVRDAGGAEISGATITVADKTAETDGSYKLGAGVYAVTVSKDGYNTVSGMLSVSGDKVARVNLYVGEPRTLTLNIKKDGFDTDIYNGDIVLQSIEGGSMLYGEYLDPATISLPDGVYKYNAHGTKGAMGGGQLVVAGNTDITLRHVDFGEKLLNQSNMAYTMTLTDQNGVAYTPGSIDSRSGGSARARFVLPAERHGTEYHYAFVPVSDTYYGSSGVTYLYDAGFGTRSYSGMNLSDNRSFIIAPKRTLTLIVPNGVTAIDGYFHLYLRVRFYEPLEEITPITTADNGDGTITYTYGVPERRELHYELKIPGYVKHARTVTVPATGTDASISLSSLTVDDGNEVSDNVIDSNIIMSAPDSKHIRLGIGEKIELYCFRNWQAINSGTGNYYVDPDFHVEVISGDSVEIIDPFYAGAFLRGVTPGVSFVRVTYDALDFVNVSNVPLIYGRLRDRNVVVLAVTVGPGAEVDTGITLRETDILYFARSVNGTVKPSDRQYAEYTFKPSGTVESVALHAPVGSNDAWTDTWTPVAPNGDGSYTLKLTEGRSIVRVRTDVGEGYHSIHAVASDIKIEGVNVGVALDGDKFMASAEVNDKLKISFERLNMPFPKLGAVYNPGYPDKTYLVYSLDSELLSEPRAIESEHTQYGISTNNTIDLAFDSPGEYVLTDGRVHTTSIGGGGGTHRYMTRGGVYWDGYVSTPPSSGGISDETVNELFGELPDITFTVAGVPDTGDAHDVTIVVPDGASLTVRNDLGYLRAPVRHASGTYAYSLVNGGDAKTYTYYAERPGYITLTDTFNVESANVELDLTTETESWLPITQSGNITVDIAGRDNIPAAGFTKQIPATPESLAAKNYVLYNYGGYTVLHALIDALGEANVAFTCDKGVLSPSAEGSGIWVCLKNGEVVPDPFTTHVNGGDALAYYYSAGNDVQYVRFEQTSVTTTQSASATLKLLTYNNGELTPYGGGGTVTLNGEALTGVAIAADGTITIPGARLRVPGEYRVTVVKPEDGADYSLLAFNLATIKVEQAATSPGSGGSASTTTVYFRLIGDTKHANGVDGHDKYVTWIATRSYTFNGDKVGMYDLFTRALRDAGLEYDGAENNYVSKIKAPAVLGGYWLGEFDNGPNSGWMYTVNGVHPNYGLLEYDVFDGQSVVWHYVDDYTRESSFEGSHPDYENRWLEAPDVNPTSGGSTSSGGGDTAGDGETTADSTTTAGSGSGSGGSQPDVVSQTTVETAPAKPDDTGKATATVETAKVTGAVAEAVKAVETAKADGKTSVVAEIIIPVTVETTETGAAVKAVEASIPAEAIKAIAEAKDVILTVESEVSTITLDAATLAAIAGAAGSGETVTLAAIAGAAGSGETVTLTAAVVDNAEALNTRQQEKVGDNPVIELNISVGDAAITEFGGVITVSVPYTPKAGTAAEDYDLLTVYYLDDNGNIAEMTGAHYDAATGQITFTTTHFSKFFISEWISPFGDIAKGEWYYKAARYAYSNGLITGVTDTTFAPQTSLTRAMLITILARDAGIDTAGGETWYSKAVEWGVANGITDGTNPNGEITREQFATMLYRHAVQELRIENGELRIANGDVSGYTDAGQISDWAYDAMAWANATGLITGRTETTLAPQGTATRAEAAMLLQRYIENLI
ncbi:MAG: S-layer homology domain-containing protein [Oscillospiraceae bacterium]|jgi:hypothetical protein|nr:S-layer homology domain-containing protein [Oscillospiraceae bacterium]